MRAERRVLAQQQLAQALWIIAEGRVHPARDAGSGKPVCNSVHEAQGEEGRSAELILCHTSAALDPRSVRNAANLELCLPPELVYAAQQHPEPTHGASMHNRADSSVPSDPATPTEPQPVFPVTLLRQGESAEHRHKLFHTSAANSGHLSKPEFAPGIWPNSSSVQGSAFGIGPGTNDPYCASCQECIEEHRCSAEAADRAFGDLLSCGHRYSTSRFAAPRLRALVSTATLPLNQARRCRPEGLSRASSEPQCSGNTLRCGAQGNVRYALVLVTEDGCHAVLSQILSQAHGFLHARLLDLVSKRCQSRWRQEHGDDQEFPDTDVDSNSFGAGLGEVLDDPVDVLRLLLHSRPLSQLLDDLVEVLSGGINVSGPSGARNSHALRAPPSLGLGSNAQGHASEVGARDSWLDISSDDVLKVAVRAAEVKGGEVWIWGGAVRFPLLRPPYDGTLGLTLFGSVKMLVDTLGKDILVLWRCVLLRRRIVVVADRADVAVRAVCGAVALIASRSVDFARRDGHSPALIDCIFPLIGMMLGPKDCDGPHDLVSGLCEREEAMMAADFAWSTTQAECCAAVNALPFYIAGVVSPPQYLGGCASGQGFFATDAARRRRSRCWHGFSSAQVLVDMSNGSIKLQDGAGEEDKQPGNDVARDADRRQGQSADFVFNGAKEWRRVPVAEHTFYHHIAAPAASQCHHEPCPPFRDNPWRKARTGTGQLRDRCSGERADATWPCVREEKRFPCTPSCENQGRRDNAEEGREKWLVRQFALLTEDLLQAVRQDRLNAHGFSRELLELKDRPLPLASAMTLATRAAPHRLSPTMFVVVGKGGSMPGQGLESSEEESEGCEGDSHQDLANAKTRDRFRRSISQAQAAIDRLSFMFGHELSQEGREEGKQLTKLSSNAQRCRVSGIDGARHARGAEGEAGEIGGPWTQQPAFRGVLGPWLRATNLLHSLCHGAGDVLLAPGAAISQSRGEEELDDSEEGDDEAPENEEQRMQALKDALQKLPMCLSELKNIYVARTGAARDEEPGQENFEPDDAPHIARISDAGLGGGIAKSSSISPQPSAGRFSSGSLLLHR